MGGRRQASITLAESLTRPYPVTAPVVVLLALVPLYVFIGEATAGRAVHVPELPLDRVIPLQPAWSLVYLSLYLFVIMPFVLLRNERAIRRTAYAYLLLWLVSYAVFILYPTGAPHPLRWRGDGFFGWTLSAIYSADVAYNCFPSLHVAQSVVSAMVVTRINRAIGIGASIWATLIALSTLFTKQHWIADVIGGVLLAVVAYALFLRHLPRDERDTRAAPALTKALVVLHLLTIAGFAAAFILRR